MRAGAWLGWLTIGGRVGIVAGFLAWVERAHRFGMDSAIEGLASVIVVWRLTGSRTLSLTSERRAQRMVAVTRLPVVGSSVSSTEARRSAWRAKQTLRRASAC